MRKKRLILITSCVLLLAVGVLTFSDVPRRIVLRTSMVVNGAKMDIDRGQPLSQILQRIAFRYMYRESEPERLNVGDIVPDINFLAVDGKSQHRLSQLIKEKPVVLIFGSYT